MVMCYNHNTVALAAEVRKPQRGQACRSKLSLVADLEKTLFGGNHLLKNMNTEPQWDNIYLCTKSDFYQKWSFLSGFSEFFGITVASGTAASKTECSLCRCFIWRGIWDRMGSSLSVSTAFMGWKQYVKNHTELEKKMFLLMRDEEKINRNWKAVLNCFKKAFWHWQTLLGCSTTLPVDGFLQHSAPERAVFVLLLSAALAASH